MSNNVQIAYIYNFVLYIKIILVTYNSWALFPGLSIRYFLCLNKNKIKQKKKTNENRQRYIYFWRDM